MTAAVGVKYPQVRYWYTAQVTLHAYHAGFRHW